MNADIVTTLGPAIPCNHNKLASLFYPPNPAANKNPELTLNFHNRNPLLQTNSGLIASKNRKQTKVDGILAGMYWNLELRSITCLQ